MTARTVRPEEVVQGLEHRTMLAAAFGEFVDPNPNTGNRFGDSILPLSTGNVVITSPGDDAGGADAGAVYLFSGASGKLIGVHSAERRRPGLLGQVSV